MNNTTTVTQQVYAQAQALVTELNKELERSRELLRQARELLVNS